MNESFSFNYLLGGALLPPASLLLLALLGLLLLRRRRRLALGLTAGSLVALLTLSLPAVAFKLADLLEGPPLPNSRAVGDAQAIVILGGGVAFNAIDWGGETVSTIALQRLRYGAWLARETRLPVLVSGDSASAGARGEAMQMRALLQTEFGVPVRWIDDRSHNTADNARHSAALLRAAGITRIALVTSALHMPRAQRMFELAGLRVEPARTGYLGLAGNPLRLRYFVPSGDALQLSHLVLREMAANLKDRLLERG